MPQMKPLSGSTGWFKHTPGQISVHADGTKWRKRPDNTWEQVHDTPKKAGAKPEAPAAQRKTYQHGQVATIGGKHFMKVGANRYAPVTQGKGGQWTHDSSPHGIEITRDSKGKVGFKKFKPLGHEVARASLRGEEKAKSALHSEHKITQDKLKQQKKELSRNPVKTIEHLRPGHIVRVKVGSTIGAEDQRKEGIVGTIKKIAGNVAHIVNDVGRQFEIPLNTLAMAKSKNGLIELRKYPRVTQIMLKALSRDDE